MRQDNFANRWELAAQIDTIAAEAKEMASSAAYVVYLIFDPSRPDPQGTYEGLPLYIGESSQVETRFKTHLRCALSRQGTAGSVHNEIYRMAERCVLPRILLLEECASRAASLEAEIRWAQKLLYQGYALFNRLPGQRAAVDEHHYRHHQRQRLWKLTLAEAAAAKIRMRVRCKGGCFAIDANLENYAAGDFPHRKLSAVKRALGPCTRCGKRAKIVLSEPSGPTGPPKDAHSHM